MPDDEKAPTMSDGARCRVCGHFEISFDRAEERYAHCPSCGRAPHWLRVPTEKSYEAHTWLKIHHWKLDGTYLELQPELGTGYWFVVDWRHPEVSIGGSLPLPQAKAAALRYARNNPRKSLVGWAPTGEEVMETKPGEAEALPVDAARIALMACRATLSRAFPNCLTVLEQFIEQTAKATDERDQLRSSLASVTKERDELRVRVDRAFEAGIDAVTGEER